MRNTLEKEIENFHLERRNNLWRTYHKETRNKDNCRSFSRDSEVNLQDYLILFDCSKSIGNEIVQAVMIILLYVNCSTFGRFIQNECKRLVISPNIYRCRWSNLNLFIIGFPFIPSFDDESNLMNLPFALTRNIVHDNNIWSCWRRLVFTDIFKMGHWPITLDI